MDVVQVNHHQRRQFFQLVEIWFAYRRLLTLRRKRKSPAVWVSNYLTKRKKHGLCATLLPTLRQNHYGHAKLFKRTLGVDEAMFDYLVTNLAPLIEREETNCREPIGVAERVSVTLYYLCTGGYYKTPNTAFWVSIPSISKIVSETCYAIVQVWRDEVIRAPNTEQQWRTISERFLERWNFPHVLGAMDGKHIRIRKPANSESRYFNYKKYFSIVLFAMVDADLRFTYMEVGAEGKSSDATLYNASELQYALEHNKCNRPPDEPLEGDDVDIPYYVISDGAFAQSPWLQKPYPGGTNIARDERVFNYRLSRARLVVECAFGVLASR